MVVIPLSSGGMLDHGDVSVPLERRVLRPLRERHCKVRVCSMGQKQMSPRLIPSWLCKVYHRMDPPSLSFRRMHSKLRAAIWNKKNEFTPGTSDAEYAGQSAQRMKELAFQMEVDALVCCIVDGTCSRSEYADARCYSKLIDIDEVGDGVRLLSV